MAHEGPSRRLPHRKGLPISPHERARQQASACQRTPPVRTELLMQLHHHAPLGSFLYTPCLCRPPSRPRALKSSGPRHRPWVLAILQAVLDSFGNHPALRSLDSERPLRGRTRPSDPIAHSASTAMRMASSVVKRMPSSAASASPYAWRPEAASTVSKAVSRTTSKKVRPTKKAPRLDRLGYGEPVL